MSDEKIAAAIGGEEEEEKKTEGSTADASSTGSAVAPGVHEVASVPSRGIDSGGVNSTMSRRTVNVAAIDRRMERKLSGESHRATKVANDKSTTTNGRRNPDDDETAEGNKRGSKDAAPAEVVSSIDKRMERKLSGESRATKVAYNKSTTNGGRNPDEDDKTVGDDRGFKDSAPAVVVSAIDRRMERKLSGEGRAANIADSSARRNSDDDETAADKPGAVQVSSSRPRMTTEMASDRRWERKLSQESGASTRRNSDDTSPDDAADRRWERKLAQESLASTRRVYNDTSPGEAVTAIDRRMEGKLSGNSRAAGMCNESSGRDLEETTTALKEEAPFVQEQTDEDEGRDEEGTSPSPSSSEDAPKSASFAGAMRVAGIDATTCGSDEESIQAEVGMATDTVPEISHEQTHFQAFLAPASTRTVTAGTEDVSSAEEHRSSEQALASTERTLNSTVERTDEVYDGVPVTKQKEKQEGTSDEYPSGSAATVWDYMSRHKVAFSALAVALAALAVAIGGLVVALQTRSLPGNSGNAGTQNAEEVLDVPITRRDALKAAIVLSIPQGLDANTSLALEDEQSPQGRALRWLAEEDGLGVDPADRPAVSQRFSLAVFYFSTGGEKWVNGANFLSDEHECRWNRDETDAFYEGITDDEFAAYIEETFNFIGAICSDDGVVRTLQMGNNFVKGTLPEELALLSDLEKLDVFANQLEGTIPSSFSTLSGLKYLDTDVNLLTGKMPTFLGELTDLEVLGLSNKFEPGPIPSFLANLKKLTQLYFYEQELTGTIPDFLARLNLTDLYLHDNRLTGTIPSGLTQMTSLQWLDVFENELTGTIGDFVSKDLILLRVSGNRLTGTIPDSLANHNKLRALYLAGNYISGTIPEKMGRNLTEMGYLWLADNHLTGTIPTEFGMMTNLRDLNLYANKLTGTIPESLVENLTEIRVVNLHINELEGTVPQSFARIGSFWTDPEVDGWPNRLWIQNNSLTGDISFLCTNSSLDVRADCAGNEAEVVCTCCADCCEDETGRLDKFTRKSRDHVDLMFRGLDDESWFGQC